MEIFRGSHTLERALLHPVVTIGNFDGLHLGHQEIVSTAIRIARELQGVAVAFTFRPHPQAALNPGRRLSLLNTYDEKIELLAGAGLDCVVEEPFSREFSGRSPEVFFNEILLRRIGAEHIVVGYDFAFGQGRQGHLANLQQLCEGAGVGLTVVPPHRVNGEVASSSRIRSHLQAGEVEKASLLLGRDFFYRGVVVRGEGRGRKLGFPTANLKLEEKIVVPYGVYATWAVWKGVIYPSVTNVGLRPTFHAPGAPDAAEFPAIIETHLPGQTFDLYGETIEVRFVSRIREERKFGGIAELIAQVSRDIGDAQLVLQKFSNV